MFSPPFFNLGGAIGGTVAKALGSEFEMQRVMANLRAMRSAEEVQRIQEFAKSRTSGLFREPNILAAAVAGQRLSVKNWMLLSDALRGTAAANGDLAEAITAVQRAMFEGEAELAERYKLLLREQNLVRPSLEIFHKKVTALS